MALLWPAQGENGCYQNPILPMDYSDPDVVRVGADYYLVASSFTYVPGVPILHSRDLVHWEPLGYCVSSLPFARYEVPAHGCGTWAPAIRYHEGRFYVFIPMPDEGIFVTTAENPAGPWSPLRCLKETAGWIDPCPFWDEDGQVYMVHAFAQSRCGIKHQLQMSRLDPDTLRVTEDGPIVFNGEQTQPVAEGPKLYRRDGWYYLFIPAGGVETGWQTVLRSRNIDGPYEEKIVLHQGNTAVNGPHQGAWVTAPDGREWFLHFQDAGALGRILHLQPLCWRGGWPFIGLEQNGDGIGEPVAQWALPAGQPCDTGWATHDDFRADRLPPCWQWQANPKADWYHCTAEGLRLIPQGAGQSLWRMPNVLSRFLPAADFTAVLSLELTGDSCACGLGVLGRSYSCVCVARQNGALRVRVYRAQIESIAPRSDAPETLVAEAPVNGDAVRLACTVSQAQTVQYSFSTPGEALIALGDPLPVTRGVWTGARLAVFARAEGPAAQGYGLLRAICYHQ